MANKDHQLIQESQNNKISAKLGENLMAGYLLGKRSGPGPRDSLSLQVNELLIVILLMVQKSDDHQLRLVVYPIFCRVFYIPGGAGFRNYQRYDNHLQLHVCDKVSWT